MRRSSWFVLFAALAILCSLAGLYALQANVAAPPMSEMTARRMVEQGVRRFNARDIRGVLNLFTADARIFGQPAGQLRKALARAFHEMGDARLSASATNVRAEPKGDHWIVTLDVDVDEWRPDADIHYFRTRLTAEVRKIRATTLFGLHETESWKIADLSANPELRIPSY